MAGHLDSVLRNLSPGRALLVNNDGNLIGIVPWTRQLRGGVAQPFTVHEYARHEDPGPWGRWIRANRISALMTQAQLAEQVEPRGATEVSRWELGKSRPSKKSRARLDELFGKGPWHD